MNNRIVSMSEPPQAARIPQVHDAIESLSNLLVGLNEAIERVERRCEAVARPIGTAGQSDPKPVHEVPVVDRLSMFCMNIRQQTERLDDLYNRLEV